jgi:hypothetical protein
MRRRLLDAPSIGTLYNVRKTKHVLNELYFSGVWFKGNVFALNTTSFVILNHFNQVNLQFLSKFLIKKSASLMNCFSSPTCHKLFSSFYFEVNYKPINENCHEADAFDCT